MATKTAMDTDMVNLNISRKVKNLYRELKNSEKRHRNSVVSSLYNTISWNSLTEKHPKLSQVTSRRKFSKTEANSRDVEKVSQCREQTSNKLETPKSVYTLPALQDEKFVMSSKHSREGRLHVPTGFQGCILFSSIKSCIQNICLVSLVREILKVSLPLLWTRSSTKNFQCCVAWTY